jgi:hypothetical protein
VQSNIKKIISKLFLFLFPVHAQAMNCSYVNNKIVKRGSSLDENETPYPAGVPSSAEMGRFLFTLRGIFLCTAATSPRSAKLCSVSRHSSSNIALSSFWSGAVVCKLSKALSKIAGPPYGQNQCAF